jgi:hypothetical protein
MLVFFMNPIIRISDFPDCVNRWPLLNLEAMTVYKIIYSGVDEKPEVACKCLKELVGANGFEPSTSWSRTGVTKTLNALSGVA